MWFGFQTAQSVAGRNTHGTKLNLIFPLFTQYALDSRIIPLTASESAMPSIKIHVMKHKDTGLLAAMSDDLKGFIVHGHSEDELFGKIGSAFAAYMDALGEPVSDVRVTQESPEGYWPPVYVASGRLEKEAA